MTPSFHARTIAAIGAGAALGLALATPSPVLAQAAGGSYGEGSEIVTVEHAPLSERSPMSNAPIDYVSESRTVTYGDLDLSTYAGARALRDRIEQAASDACGDISMRYVVVQDNNRQCIIDAARSALYRTPLGPSMRGLR